MSNKNKDKVRTKNSKKKPEVKSTKESVKLSVKDKTPTPNTPSDRAVKDTIRFVLKQGYKPLAKMLLMLWKKNPYPVGSRKRTMFNEQAGTNIPLLYFGSIRLFEYAQKLKIKNLLFVTRDCIHWHRIFSALFQDHDFKVTYFHSSRIMFQEAVKKKNKFYQAYVDEVSEGDISKCIYADVHGTAKNYLAYCEKLYPNKAPACFLLTIGADNYREMPKECYALHKKGRLIGAVRKTAGSPAEMLNYDTIGSLVNFDKQGARRMEVEYDIKLLKPYHQCVDLFLKIHEKSSAYDIDAKNLDACFAFLGRRIKDRKKQPTISTWVKHTRKHLDDFKKHKEQMKQSPKEKVETEEATPKSLQVSREKKRKRT